MEPGETNLELAEVEKPDEVHAYIGVQTKVYTFRNSVSDDTYGLESGHFDTLIKWEDTDGDGKDDITDTGAAFADAAITQDGTYTVSVSGYDFAADSDGLNMLFVSTDFPYNGKLRIKDFVLTLDGVDTPIDKPLPMTRAMPISRSSISTMKWHRTPRSTCRMTASPSASPLRA